MVNEVQPSKCKVIMMGYSKGRPQNEYRLVGNKLHECAFEKDWEIN